MNYDDKPDLDFSSYEDAELKKLFDTAATDSESYAALMEELTRRGYEFEPETDETDETEVESAEELESEAQKPRTLHYSYWGSRLWNIIALVISLAGATFFLQTHRAIMEPDPSLQIMVYGMAALVVSASFLISGIRMLANHKDAPNPNLVISTLEYWIITVLWFAISAYQLYQTGSAFTKYLELGWRISLYVALPSLVISIFAFFLAMAFLYLARELKVAKPIKAMHG
jgi:hypothetical protein